MSFNPAALPESVVQLLLGLLAGLLATLLLWRWRGSRPGRRAIASIWLALAATWLYRVVVVTPLLVPAGEARPPVFETFANLVTAAWVMLTVNAGVQVLDLLLWELVFSRRGLPPRVPRLILDVFNLLVLIVALLSVLNQVFGVDLTTLLVTSTVASAVIGLALQDVLRNVIAGLALQMESPFGLGDWIEVAGHEGCVMQMNWRTVTIRTRQQANIILTNGKVASEDLINHSRPDPVQGIDAYVGVAYPHPPGEVAAALAEAVRGTEGVLDTPAPRVYVQGYQDFSIEYRIRYWVRDYARLHIIRGNLMIRLWYGLRRAGFGIPFPIRDVNLRQVPEDAEARRMATQRESMAASLRPLALFAALDDSQIERLAANASLRRYTASELLFREAEPGDSLFVIRSGQIRVEIEQPDGSRLTVARRGPGEIFGEMSLLTGAPRSATVVADTELEVVVVDKAAFAGLLLADPAIAEGLSAILAERQAETEARVAEAAGRPATPPLGRREEILGHIRAFFGLSGSPQ